MYLQQGSEKAVPGCFEAYLPPPRTQGSHVSARGRRCRARSSTHMLPKKQPGPPAMGTRIWIFASAASFVPQPAPGNGGGELSCSANCFHSDIGIPVDASCEVHRRPTGRVEGQGEVVLLGHIVQGRVPHQLDAGGGGQDERAGITRNSGAIESQPGGTVWVACRQGTQLDACEWGCTARTAKIQRAHWACACHLPQQHLPTKKVCVSVAISGLAAS